MLKHAIPREETSRISIGSVPQSKTKNEGSRPPTNTHNLQTRKATFFRRIHKTNTETTKIAQSQP